MSLSEAVLTVVEAMEAEAGEKWPCESGSFDVAVMRVAALQKALKSYARELRVAVKASAGSAAPPTTGWGSLISPQAQHAQMIDLAREEFRKHKQRGEAEEGMDGKMVMARGGPCDGTMVNVPNDVTPKMRSIIAGGVYEYGEDNLLHHLPQDPAAKTQ